MDLFLYFLIIAVGFLITIKGADFLIEGASSFAKRFGISDLVIGLTVVALGTSAPEMIVNVYSSIKGRDELVLGNIIGSNLFNTLVILGITALIFPIAVKKGSALKEIPYAFFAAFIVLFFVNDQITLGSSENILTRGEGITLLLFFLLFIAYVIRMTLKGDDESEEHPEILPPLKTAIFLLLGMAGLGLGGQLVVDNAINIAKALHVSDAVIGLTILAAGTSLPELVASVVAAKKKRSDMVIGNIIGSNIFNIFLVLGVSSVISPIHFDTKLNIDLLVLITGSIMLFAFMFTGKKYRIDRSEAGLLLLLYISYFVYMMIR